MCFAREKNKLFDICFVDGPCGAPGSRHLEARSSTATVPVSDVSVAVSDGRCLGPVGGGKSNGIGGRHQG